MKRQTLKRFRKNKNTVVLIPANEDMESMKFPAADVEIRGVLVAVLRTMRK
jgi:SOS-response transcriptional repressor LexA